MNEAELSANVIEAARLRGWVVAHFRPARTEHGWRTPVEADGAGFPDLVLARPPRLIFAELKGERGRLSEPQQAWLELLGEVEGPLEVFVWRPEHWLAGAVDAVLA